MCDGSEDEIEIDDFKNFELEIKKFNESLFPRVDNENEKVENKFCKVVLYALRFDKTELKDTCNNEEFEKIIDNDFFEKLSKPEKLKFIIDLQKFPNLCYEINSTLSKHNYFLRVFELKNKFWQFSIKAKSKQKIVRQLSSCLIEKYSGFTGFQSNIKKNKRNYSNL